MDAKGDVRVEILNEIILQVEIAYKSKEDMKEKGFEYEKHKEKLSEFINKIKELIADKLGRNNIDNEELYENLTKVPFILYATFVEEKQANDARMSVDLDNLLKPTIDAIFKGIKELVECKDNSDNKCPLNDSQIVHLSATRLIVPVGKPRRVIVQVIPAFVVP